MARDRTTVHSVPAQVTILPIARGSLAAAFGALALVRPYLLFETLLALFGTYVLLDGVVAAFETVVAFRKTSNWLPFLLQAGTGVVAGAVAILHPTMTAAVLIGMWGLVSGGWRLVAVFGTDTANDNTRLTLSGIGTVMLGTAMFLYPFIRNGYLALVFTGYAALFALIQFNIAARTGDDI